MGRARDRSQPRGWAISGWRLRRTACLAAVAAAALVGASTGTQDANANGDTRTLTILHMHTKESATITFRRGGRYDPEALNQLNWLLRDWRLDQPIRMDPRLFDIVWEVHRLVGSAEPVHVVSAYRSPGTNAALRRRSRAVAEHSQHMLGKAMDFYLPDVSSDRIRHVAMRLQHGGVGFYPTANTPFIHLDAGGVRSWPRMTRDQLARLFPDGKTVHLPRDGKPLDRYEEARAEILARGGSVLGAEAALAEAPVETGRRRSLWAMLFGGDEDEDTEYLRSTERRGRGLFAGASRPAAAASGNSDDAGTRAALYAPAAPAARQEAPREVPAQTAALSSAVDPAGGAMVLNPPASRADMPASVPMPPRRPGGAQGLALAAMPMPPSRPTELSARIAAAVDQGAAGIPARSGPERAQVRPGQRDRARLQSLFTAATTAAPAANARVATTRAKPRGEAPAGLVGDGGAGLALSFAPLPAADLDAARFAGPAIQPLSQRR